MKLLPSRLKVFLALCVSSGFLLVGCATKASLRPTSADGVLGTPRYYYHDRAVVFQVAQEAARDLGLTIAESAPDQSYFIAKRGATGLHLGILVGVYFTMAVDNATFVVIRTEPKFAANIAVKDYTTLLHASMRRRLEAKDSDKPNPA